MEQTSQTAQPETVAPFTAPDEHSAGSLTESPSAWITTREAATLLGKSPGNIRARASKGDFGPTQAGPDGLPRYDRERVRAVGERMAARQARGGSLTAPSLNLSAQAPSLTALLDIVQAQRAEQSALCQAWVEEARETARLAKAEAQELRALLLQREETTRETLSHMDMLHDQNLRQAQEAWARERAHWERERAAKDAELERLRASVPSDKNRASFWGKPAKES